MACEPVVEGLTIKSMRRNSLTLVEDASTARAMQRGVPEEIMTFGWPFMAPTGASYQNIYVKWPCQNWFERRKIDQTQLQDWVRMYLMARKAPGGDFQYI